MSLPNPGVRNGLLYPSEKLDSVSPSKLCSNVLEFLKPEIFQRRSRKPLKPTAWLDGLRGWAAFLVICLHLCIYTHPLIEHCWNSPMEDGQILDTPGAWPFVRLFFSGGHFAVMLFFTISGYVIAIRLLGLLHEERKSEFIDAFHSAALRRPFRLYLPVIWSTGFLPFLWHVVGIQTPWPVRQSNFWTETWNWLLQSGEFCDFFRAGYLFTVYNVHTWTIPVELRGSMFLFIWLFLWHRMENRKRIIAQAFFTVFLVCGTPAAWYACFFAGMLTAELDMLGNAQSTVKISLPWDGFFKWLRANTILRWTLLHLMLVAGLFLGGQPSDSNMSQEEILGSCTGWQTLSYLVPKSYHDDHGSFRWFWLFWAAWLTIVSVKEIPWAKAIFEFNFSQYLGKHSFALYLIHGPIGIGMIGERLFYLTGFKKIDAWDTDNLALWGGYLNKWSDASWWPLSNEGPYGMEPNFVFSQVLTVIISLYVAELGTKLFDAPSVKFSKWVESLMKGRK